MKAFFVKTADFVLRYWWPLFTLALIWTFISGYLWYVSVFYYNPVFVLEMIGWDHQPDVVDSLKPWVYFETLGLTLALSVTTYVPVPFLLYLRFFGARINGRV